MDFIAWQSIGHLREAVCPIATTTARSGYTTSCARSYAAADWSRAPVSTRSCSVLPNRSAKAIVVKSTSTSRLVEGSRRCKLIARPDVSYSSCGAQRRAALSMPGVATLHDGREASSTRSWVQIQAQGHTRIAQQPTTPIFSSLINSHRQCASPCSLCHSRRPSSRLYAKLRPPRPPASSPL